MVDDWSISQSGGAWCEIRLGHLLNLILIALNSLDPQPRALVNSHGV